MAGMTWVQRLIQLIKVTASRRIGMALWRRPLKFTPTLALIRMKHILAFSLLLLHTGVFGQYKEHMVLWGANPYLHTNDPNFSLDSLDNTIEGQLSSYNGDPCVACYVWEKKANGQNVLHYCDSSGKYYLSKNESVGSVVFCAMACLKSDTVAIQNGVIPKLRVQSALPHEFRSETTNCNHIKNNLYYVNTMLIDAEHYKVELGRDILKQDSVEVLFYKEIVPDELYTNDEGSSIRGSELIRLQLLPYDDWDGTLFTPNTN